MSSSPLDLATETKRRFDAKKQSRAVDETHARDTYGRRNPKPSRGSVNTGKYKSSGVEVALIVSASIDWGKRCPHFLAERLVSCGSPCARVLACAKITNQRGRVRTDFSPASSSPCALPACTRRRVPEPALGAVEASVPRSSCGVKDLFCFVLFRERSVRGASCARVTCASEGAAGLLS